MFSFLMFEHEVVIAQTGSQTGATSQARTRVHGYTEFTVSVSQEPNSLDEVRNYFTVQLPEESEHGKIWELASSNSKGVDDLTPTKLVVKEVWGGYDGLFSKVVEYQIFDPKEDYGCQEAIALIKQEFELDDSDKIIRDIFFDQKVIDVEDGNKTIKSIYRFRKDGKLAVRFLYKDDTGKWDEDARFVYKNSNINYEENDPMWSAATAGRIEATRVGNVERPSFGIAPMRPRYNTTRRRRASRSLNHVISTVTPSRTGETWFIATP